MKLDKDCTAFLLSYDPRDERGGHAYATGGQGLEARGVIRVPTSVHVEVFGQNIFNHASFRKIMGKANRICRDSRAYSARLGQ